MKQYEQIIEIMEKMEDQLLQDIDIKMLILPVGVLKHRKQQLDELFKMKDTFSKLDLVFGH